MTGSLLDAKQAGALLNVPASWMLAEARAGRIPHIRLGRYVRFAPDALEGWWRLRMRGPVPAGYDRHVNTPVGRATLERPRPVAQGE
jgi:excisionase family DNA binding protein